MKSISISLGRREFLHSAAVLGAGAGVAGAVGACSDNGTETGDARFLRVDATVPSTGHAISLDARFDVRIPAGAFTSDANFCGYQVSPSGDISDLCVTVEKAYANALTLRQLSGNRYGVFLNGVQQPPEGPFEITLTEHAIPETNVSVIAGRLFDPKRSEHMTFTVTHSGAAATGIAIGRLFDPERSERMTVTHGAAAAVVVVAPAVIIVVIDIAAALLLICGATILVAAAACVAVALLACKHGVKSYGFKTSLGFLGCTTSCNPVCNTQGSGS